jgi:hypothetical protein
MPLRDEEVHAEGIAAREHIVRRNSLTGRARYPFKFMLLNDYFSLTTLRDVNAARDALKSFNRRDPSRRFTVRMHRDGEWICRRVV